MKTATRRENRKERGDKMKSANHKSSSDYKKSIEIRSPKTKS